MLEHNITVESRVSPVLRKTSDFFSIQPSQFDKSSGPLGEIETLFKVFLEHDKKARFLLTIDHNLHLANAKAREMIDSGQISFDARGHLRFASQRSQLSITEVLFAAHKTVNHWHYKVLRLMDSEWCGIHARVLEYPFPYVELSIQHAAHSTEQDLTPLTDAFGLTLTEGKVLKDMIQAKCPKVIAIDNDISVHTVRAHIRSIFAKMGTHSSASTLSLVLALTA